MESIRLRAATQKDASQIKALIHIVGINPFGLNWRRFFLAVDEQDRLIGCGQIKPHGDGSRELASIAVQPGYQKQGIGTKLVLKLIESAAPPLYLMCRTEMVPYYIRFGFVLLAPEQMPAYFRRIMRLVAFTRSLSPRLDEIRVMRRG